MTPDQQASGIQSDALRERLQGDDRPFVIDVRTPEEFAAGHVDGAVNIPKEELTARAGEIPPDAHMVAVCNLGGARSCGAAQLLKEHGIAQAEHLIGGLAA